MCRVDELRPHPSYVRHHLTVPAGKLAVLSQRGDLAFNEPLVITSDRMIIDGYARLELARHQNRHTVSCVQYEIAEPEALDFLLQRHRRSSGLNDFVRVLLALDLEPYFKEKARSNQRAAGHLKGSSKLTEAERSDVRLGVAAAAGVSAGNVTKVKQLTKTSHPEVLEALRNGEVRIHRAWQWSKQPAEQQREALRVYRSKRGIAKKIRNLVSRHRVVSRPTVPDASSMAQHHQGSVLARLSALANSEPGVVSVAVIKAPGKTVFVTEELFEALGSQLELGLKCETTSR